MFFRKLALENFRSHVKTTLDLAPLTVCRGANASGKSSIEQALQLILAGRTDATTADGKGSIGLIRAGASKASITLAINQDGEERIVKMALNGATKSTVVIRPGDPQYSGGSDYIESLALSREVFSCLCNNRYFVDLKEDEQQDVLARIVLPKQYIWPEWVKPMANTLGLRINWNLVPFELIGAAYDAAFKERTGVTRDLKNHAMPTGDTSEADKLEEYSRAVGTLRTEVDTAKKRKYDLEAASRHAAATLKAAQERLATSTARLSREQQEIAGMEAAILSPAKLKEADKLAKNAAKVGAADKDIARLDAEVLVNKVAFGAINELSAKQQCPTCSSEITEEVVAAIAGPIVAQRSALAEQHRQAVELRKSLGNPAEAIAAISAHDRAQINMKRSTERIREEQSAIRDAEAAIANYEGAKEPDTAELDTTIAQLEAKLESATGDVARARSAKELVTRKAAAQVELDTLTGKQRDLNRLLTYFGDEVLTELLAAHMGPFVAEMNEVLASWGFVAALSMRPYSLAISFGTVNGASEAIQLKHLSKSQRYRFGVAFQAALAITTDYKFVVCDESDILDPEARGGLYEALTTGVLDQVIILGTDTREEVPDVPDSVFYRLDDVAEQGMVPVTQVRRLMPDVEVAA